MKLSQSGEFGLIGILAAMVQESRDANASAWKNLAVGIGDDAAAWKNAGQVTLATTDCLVQDVHFRLGQSSWRDLGWKALAVNLSDIAAMGGTPQYALVTLGLPPETDVEDIKELYTGMLELAGKCGVAICGGDTTSSKTVFISLAVTGSAGKHLLSRSGAQAGDLIAVTGYPGMAAAGLKLTSSATPPNDNDALLRQAFLKPSPRNAEGLEILTAGGKCAIDISDGLVADLGHICRASGVGARIETEHIPLHEALLPTFPEQSLDLALGGGEDYELLFTGSPALIDKVRAKTQIPVTIIGEITADASNTVQLVGAGGLPYKIRKAGWDHFAGR